MPNYRVAGKYALALYITTVRKIALELVEAELQQVCGAVETNLVFPDFHKDPSVSKTVRVEAIVEIFKNIKFNDVMKMKPELSPIFDANQNPWFPLEPENRPTLV